LLATLTLPQAFALIPTIVLYTPKDVRINWLDRQQTELGCCRPAADALQADPAALTEDVDVNVGSAEHLTFSSKQRY